MSPDLKKCKKTDSRGANERLRALVKELDDRRKEMEKAVQTLPQRIIQAQEEDRKKISREIHDDLGQSLATLKMLIQAHQAEMTRRHGCKPVKSFQKIITYLDTIIDKTRSLAAGLQPSILEVLGPTAALKALMNEFRSKKGMRIHFDCIPLEQFAFKAEVINLYRIIQEALTNIVRHAGATHIDIRFRKFRNSLRINVKDNGCGLCKDDKPNLANGFPAGLGFSTMRERAMLLGGNMEVKSSPQGGTSLTVEIPIQIRQP
jgi:two-component system sensor histidine kinase UhpB